MIKFATIILLIVICFIIASVSMWIINFFCEVDDDEEDEL